MVWDIHRNTTVLSAYCGEACNFIPQSFGLNDGHLLCHSLVSVKVKSQTCIILLDDDPGGFLDGFRSNAALQIVETCIKP